MSISMKSILVAAVASLVVDNAMAANGTINFKGEITAAARSVTEGAGATVGGAVGNQTIDVNLGKISIDSLSDTAGGSIAGGTSLNLNLDCGKTGAGLTTVKLKSDPMSGTGIDSYNRSLLEFSKNSTATGVGIGIYGSDGRLLNLSANETIGASLNSRVEKDGESQDITLYNANLSLRAAYVRSGAAAATAGVASGSLPFTLEYN